MPGIWGAAAATQSQPSGAAAANNDDLHHDEMMGDNQDMDMMDLADNDGDYGDDYDAYNQMGDELGGDYSEFEDVGGGDDVEWGEEEEPSEANADLENQNDVNASGVGKLVVAPGKDHGEDGEAERGAEEKISPQKASGSAGAASLEGDFTTPKMNDGGINPSKKSHFATLAQVKDATTATVVAEASNQQRGLDVLSTAAAAKATHDASNSVAANKITQLLKSSHPSGATAHSETNQCTQRVREDSLSGATMEPSALSGTNDGPTSNGPKSTAREVRPHQGGVTTGMMIFSDSSASVDQRIVPGMTTPEDKNAALVAQKASNGEALKASGNSQAGAKVPEASTRNGTTMLTTSSKGTQNGDQQSCQVRQQIPEKAKASSLGAGQNTMLRSRHSFSKGPVSEKHVSPKSHGPQRSTLERATHLSGNGSRASASTNRLHANSNDQRRPSMLAARPSQLALARTTGPSVTRERLFETPPTTVTNPSGTGLSRKLSSGGAYASRGNSQYSQASTTGESHFKSSNNTAGGSGHSVSNGCALLANQRSTTLGHANDVRSSQPSRQEQGGSRGSGNMNAVPHQTNNSATMSTTSPSNPQKQQPFRSMENCIPPETPPTHTSILRGGESGHFKTPDQNQKRRVVFDSHITTATLNEDRMAVTPGPMTALKIQNNRQPSDTVVADHKSNAIGFMSMDEAENNERILPAPDNNSVPTQRSFEEDYADFQRMIRDLTDDHERKTNAMLNLNDLLATAHAETLQDQGDLVMFLGDIGRLNAELEDQIGEYEMFLNSFPESE